MQNDIRIVRRVKELVAEEAPYQVIRGVIKGSYRVELTESDVLKYNSMTLPPQEAAIEKPYRPPSVKPKSEAPRSFWQEMKSTFCFMGAGALVGTVLAGGILGYLVKQELDERKADLVKDQYFVSKPIKEAAMFHPNILLQTGGSYAIDSNGDKKPDALVNETVLRTAGDILSLGVQVDPSSLIQSLYDTGADNVIVRSPDRIVATKGGQAAVYRLGANGLAIDPEVTKIWDQINSQILGALKSDANAEEKGRSIASAFGTDSEAASFALNSIGGKGFESYLQQKAALDITQYYSRVVAGNFSDAGASALTGNVPGVVGNLFAAWFNEQVARSAVQGMQGGNSVSSSSDDYPRMPSGEYQRITVVDKRSGTMKSFTNPEEAEQYRRDLDEMWKSWDNKK